MGLGGISAESMFDDISYDDLSTKLNKLKNRYLEGDFPNLKERKQRLKKLIDIVENNADAIGDAVPSSYEMLVDNNMQLIGGILISLSLLRLGIDWYLTTTAEADSGSGSE